MFLVITLKITFAGKMLHARVSVSYSNVPISVVFIAIKKISLLANLVYCNNCI